MDSACYRPEKTWVFIISMISSVQEMHFHISIHQAHRKFLGFWDGGEKNVTFLIQSPTVHVVKLFQAIDKMFCGDD